MNTFKNYDEDILPSSKTTGNALCDSFNKLQVRKAAKNCLYEDFILARTRLFLLQNDDVDPAIPSKLDDIIQNLKKFLIDVPLHIRRSKQCIEDFYRMLLFLQDYVSRYTEVFKQYPLTQDLLSLLVQYVELEYEVLYLSDCYSAEYQKQVENRVLTYLLLLLYDPSGKKGTKQISAVDRSTINALYVIKNVKSDYKREHDLIENLMSKLLRKLNVLDTMNTFKSGIVDADNAEKLLQIPRLHEISKHLLSCSYVADLTESDDDIQEIDIPRPMQLKSEQKEVKHEISQNPCFNIEENLNSRSDLKNINVDRNTSNKCKCGHYNCSISCNDLTVYVSDDEDNSDVEFTETNPVPIIDLEVDSILETKSEQTEVVQGDNYTSTIDSENESHSNVAETTPDLDLRLNQENLIEVKVDVSPQHSQNTKNAKSQNRGAIILISDDEDDSDIEITGTEYLAIINVKDEINQKNDAFDNRERIPQNEERLSEKSTSKNNVTNSSAATRDEQQNSAELESTTDVASNSVSDCITESDQEIIEKSLQIETATTSEQTTESENVTTIEDVSEKSSDPLQPLSGTDLFEDCENEAELIEPKGQLPKRNTILEDEATHNQISKNIIDQLESAIQNTETFSSVPERQTENTEVTSENVHYECDKQIEEIVSEHLETEEIVQFQLEQEVAHDEILDEYYEKGSVALKNSTHEEIVSNKIVESIASTEIVEEESCEKGSAVLESSNQDEIVSSEIIEEEGCEKGSVCLESSSHEEIVSSEILESVASRDLLAESIASSEILEEESYEQESAVLKSSSHDEIISSEILEENCEKGSVDLESSTNEEIVSSEVLVQSIASSDILAKSIASSEILEEEPYEKGSVALENFTHEEIVSSEISVESIASGEILEEESYEKGNIALENSTHEEMVSSETSVESIASSEILEESCEKGSATLENCAHEEIVSSEISVESITSTETLEKESVALESSTHEEIVSSEIVESIASSEIIEEEFCEKAILHEEIPMYEEVVINDISESESLQKEPEYLEASLNLEISNIESFEEEFCENQIVYDEIPICEEVVTCDILEEEAISNHENNAILQNLNNNEPTYEEGIGNYLLEEESYEKMHNLEVSTYEESINNEVLEEESTVGNLEITIHEETGNTKIPEENNENTLVITSTDVVSEETSENWKFNSEEQITNEIITEQKSDNIFHDDANVTKDDHDCVNNYTIDQPTVEKTINTSSDNDHKSSDEPEINSEDPQPPEENKTCSEEKTVSVNEERIDSPDQSNQCEDGFQTETIIESSFIEPLRDDNQISSTTEDHVSSTSETRIISAAEYTDERVTTTNSFTNLDVLADAASDLLTSTNDFQSESNVEVGNENLVEEKTCKIFEDEANSVAEKLDDHIGEDYVHEETVTTGPCEMFAEENPLFVLATATEREREKLESVRVKNEKKSKKSRKKTIKKETIEELPPRRITRSSTVSKVTNSNAEVNESIPSTFMNLENLVTPPPICVYNLIPSSITDDESIDEPFSSVQNLQEILVRNVAYDEDTLDDGITLISHEKEINNEVMISIPDSEKDFPGINYEILNQTENFTESTNLSFSTSEELCKELKLTMTKNKELTTQINNDSNKEDVSVPIENQNKPKNKKKTVMDKIAHTMPLKKRKNYGKKSNVPCNSDDKIEPCTENVPQNVERIEKSTTHKITEDVPEVRIPSVQCDRPFPTKAALKCFQIPCNPYVQLQKLPVTCDTKGITKNENREKNQVKIASTEKNKSKSTSESVHRKNRRSTTDCVLNADDETKKTTKLTRRRMSSKFSHELLMGLENGLEMDEIFEKEELTVKPMTRSHVEKTKEKNIMQTRSKSNRIKSEINTEKEKTVTESHKIIESLKKTKDVSIAKENASHEKQDCKNEVLGSSSKKLEDDFSSANITHKSKSKTKKQEIKNSARLVKDEPVPNVIEVEINNKTTVPEQENESKIDTNKKTDDCRSLDVQCDTLPVTEAEISDQGDTPDSSIQQIPELQSESNPTDECEKTSDQMITAEVEKITNNNANDLQLHETTKDSENKIDEAEDVLLETNKKVTQDEEEQKIEVVVNTEVSKEVELCLTNENDVINKKQHSEEEKPHVDESKEEVQDKPESTKLPENLQEKLKSTTAEDVLDKIKTKHSETKPCLSTRGLKSTSRNRRKCTNENEKRSSISAEEVPELKVNENKTKDKISRSKVNENESVTRTSKEELVVNSKELVKKREDKVKNTSKQKQKVKEVIENNLPCSTTLDFNENSFFFKEDVSLIPLPPGQPKSKSEAKSENQTSNVTVASVSCTDNLKIGSEETIPLGNEIILIPLPKEPNTASNNTTTDCGVADVDKNKSNLWTIDKIINTSDECTQQNLHKGTPPENQKTVENVEQNLVEQITSDVLVTEHSNVESTVIDVFDKSTQNLTNDKYEEHALDLSNTSANKINTDNQTVVSIQEIGDKIEDPESSNTLVEEVKTKTLLDLSESSNLPDTIESEITLNLENNLETIGEGNGEAANVVVNEDVPIVEECEKPNEEKLSTKLDSVETNKVDDFKNTRTNVFTKVKLKRRNTISTDTDVLKEQNDRVHEKNGLEKYNIESITYRKIKKIIPNVTNDKQIQNANSDQSDEKSNQQNEKPHTDNNLTNVEVLTDKEERYSSDDDLILISAESPQKDIDIDEYAYDSEPLIEKLFEKYAKKRVEPEANKNKKSKEKHVKFCMERNTVKRISPFIDEEEAPSTSKKIRVDEPKNHDSKTVSSSFKKKHSAKVGENVTKELTKEINTDEKEVENNNKKEICHKKEETKSVKPETQKLTKIRDRSDSPSKKKNDHNKKCNVVAGKNETLISNSDDKFYGVNLRKRDRKRDVNEVKVKESVETSKKMKNVEERLPKKHDKVPKETHTDKERSKDKKIPEKCATSLSKKSTSDEKKVNPPSASECPVLIEEEKCSFKKQHRKDVVVLFNDTLNKQDSKETKGSDRRKSKSSNKKKLNDNKFISVQIEKVSESKVKIDTVQKTVENTDLQENIKIIDEVEANLVDESTEDNSKPCETVDVESTPAIVEGLKKNDQDETLREVVEIDTKEVENNGIKESMDTEDAKLHENNFTEECHDAVEIVVENSENSKDTAENDLTMEINLCTVDVPSDTKSLCETTEISFEVDKMEEPSQKDVSNNIYENDGEIRIDDKSITETEADKTEILYVKEKSPEVEEIHEICTKVTIEEMNTNRSDEINDDPQLEQSNVSELVNQYQEKIEEIPVIENEVPESCATSIDILQKKLNEDDFDDGSKIEPFEFTTKQNRFNEYCSDDPKNDENQYEKLEKNETNFDDVDPVIKLDKPQSIHSGKKNADTKKRESKRIDLIIENLKIKTSKCMTDNSVPLTIYDKIDHEEHVESTVGPDNFLAETDASLESTEHENETVQSDLEKTEAVESFFPEFALEQTKLNTEASHCEDMFPYIDRSKKEDCLLEIDSNENPIEIATSLENPVSLLEVNDKQVDAAEASTPCEITDNLIAVMFSEQNRSNKTGFIFFKGSDHNYHSMGDPLLGGDCDIHESDHSSDNKEIPSPELENVLVNDTILPFISTLTDNHQESSEDSGADFQLMELIDSNLATESSPPLTQAVNCENLYQTNIKQVELEYDQTPTSSGVDFSKINSEAFINQFQQPTMSVENMSELMNVVLSSIQNLNNMTKPVPIMPQDLKETLFLPSDLDLNDVVQQSEPENLDLMCDFSQTRQHLNSECSASNTPILETDYSNLQISPTAYDNSVTVSHSPTKKVIVEHIPQYEEPVKEAPQPEIIVIEKTKKPVKLPSSRPKLSEAIAFAKQNSALSSTPKKPLNNVGFVRTSSKTKPSAPKPKKISDPKKDSKQEVENPVQVNAIETFKIIPASKHVTSTSPPKERSLPIIEDVTPNLKKQEVKVQKVKEDENIVRQQKQSPAYAKSPRTPRQTDQKIEFVETGTHNDMIDNVKRRKRKPVDYSSIEKLLEYDEFDFPKLQKQKHKKDEKIKPKPKEEDAKAKKMKPPEALAPSTSTVSDDQAASLKTRSSIFEDSDDDVPKKKKSKPEPPLEEDAMNALFDRLVKESDVNKGSKSNVAKSSQNPPKPTASNIFSIDSALQKKPETTPVKQIGVVNPIPRQSNLIRKELVPNRGSYGGSEESRTSSQYYQYYPDRSRRSYPYSSRESRDSRPSVHQSSNRRPEYSAHLNDQRYSSQRSSSSSRSSRSSRHHSNSRSNTEQRGYWFGSNNDLSWREDMKKKFPNVFKDEFF